MCLTYVHYYIYKRRGDRDVVFFVCFFFLFCCVCCLLVPMYVCIRVYCVFPVVSPRTGLLLLLLLFSVCMCECVLCFCFEFLYVYVCLSRVFFLFSYVVLFECVPLNFNFVFPCQRVCILSELMLLNLCFSLLF